MVGAVTARGVAGGAMLIGAITVLARVIGFAKQYAFAGTVGTNCLSTAYMTANQIPNIIFEVVAGGALAGLVVPMLAGAAGRGSRERAGRIGSALLTWVLVVLVPVGVLLAVFAGPITGLFFGGAVDGCDVGDVSAVATRMLVVFAPQIPLYGVAVVLYGVLQSHKRFTGPAVAPLVSSIVVIVAYLLFVPLSGGTSDPGALPGPAELALSVGTSLGVLSLVLAVLGPVARLGLRWRPTLRFPDGVAGQVRRLALAGIAALLAQQAAMIVVLVLSNHAIGNGAIAVYNYAWAIYLVPYAVLAVPIATSAFPRLSAQAGDPEAFAALSARTTRAVVLVSGLAAGVLAAASGPGAVVFLADKSEVPPGELAAAIALFTPGLIGYGLIAHLSRVLYAAGRGRAVAVGTVAGWGVVIVAQIVFVLVLPDGWEIGGMALGMSVGMSVGGGLLLRSVVAARGRAAVAGLLRAGAAAVGGGLLGYLAGAGVVALLGVSGVWANVGAAVLGAVVALVVGGAVVALADRPDTDALTGLLRRRGGDG
ncbi:murein biosynthesis integral membrane protein MurJ [Nonomuraea gerenzanensis]|uniref:Proposed peptidoglycan lipid II flippase MurJ n=1 Tax=Nonomuraea gerenzanensis TaxID=93944 RepID=A0A1M4EHL0_9ACTN|nr:lipid II flippase MurJ [Nonomuraea gerenzanensis]UBU09796.1 virulence factor MviN [Nonomuraea gerenzanensis]SBO98244.1 Proposed peptidoglycan lipid II flippase MurJ [Nonomuraea gerenzanensis]